MREDDTKKSKRTCCNFCSVNNIVFSKEDSVKNLNSIQIMVCAIGFLNGLYQLAKV